jgi:hypothetical protein
VSLKASPITLFESDQEISMPVARRAGGLAYRMGDTLYFWVRGSAPRSLPVAPGRVLSAFWSADDASLLYLHVPDNAAELNSIREHVLKTGEDKLVAKTTQYTHFCQNSDSTVFAGISGSKASPHVLILIRAVRRELTMCEHRARDPKSLAIAFTPNSQRILFQSDQHGKAALYTMTVDRFVSETES